MKQIPLTQGKFAIVDDEDYDYLMQWKWKASPGRSTWYATRGEGGSNGKQTTICMHRVITGAAKGQHTDHINHNGLDNRRCNLRLCTNLENHLNRLPQKNCSSDYKGVTWNKRLEKWAAQIMLHSKNHHLGYFKDEINAAYAYDEKAKELFGEFAYLNFPDMAVRAYSRLKGM